MNGLWRKRGQTYGDVFGAFRLWRAVLHPFPGASDHCLPGVHIQRAIPVRHAQRASEHNRELVELRSLTRFNPSARTAHVSHAQARLAAVHAADVLVDEFRFIACGCDSSWFGDKSWHTKIRDLDLD